MPWIESRPSDSIGVRKEALLMSLKIGPAESSASCPVDAGDVGRSVLPARSRQAVLKRVDDLLFTAARLRYGTVHLDAPYARPRV